LYNKKEVGLFQRQPDEYLSAAATARELGVRGARMADFIDTSIDYTSIPQCEPQRPASDEAWMLAQVRENAETPTTSFPPAPCNPTRTSPRVHARGEAAVL